MTKAKEMAAWQYAHKVLWKHVNTEYMHPIEDFATGERADGHDAIKLVSAQIKRLLRESEEARHEE